MRDEELPTEADEIHDPMVDPEDRAMQLGAGEPDAPANTRKQTIWPRTERKHV